MSMGEIMFGLAVAVIAVIALSAVAILSKLFLLPWPNDDELDRALAVADVTRTIYRMREAGTIGAETADALVEELVKVSTKGEP